MKRLLRLVRDEVAYVVGRLAEDHTLEILGLEVTTERHARERAHNAFELGVECGASKRFTPKPASAPVLQIVRSER